MAIDLVLSDDWELRGDGSGSMPALQFATARRLMDLFERYSFRGTFNVEVMQQLGHRRWGERYRHLAILADQWDDCVREMRQRGHDVQLHVHPQWHDAVYDGRAWKLQSNWSIIEYPESDVRLMLFECRDYLHSLLRRDEPDYRCRSFRSGSWSLAPSRFMLSILAEMGIAFDMSMGQGIYYDLPMVRLDYRNLEEPFFPYYPQMDDARQMAEAPQPIVCIPTHSRNSRSRPLRHLIQRTLLPVTSRITWPAANAYLFSPSAIRVSGDATGENYGQRWRNAEPKVKQSIEILIEALRGRDIVTDVSLLAYRESRAALFDALRRSDHSSTAPVPVIFENHTKNVGNFAPLEQLCRLLARTPGVRVSSAAEVADRLEGGEYAIRCRMPQQAEQSRATAAIRQKAA